MKYLRVLLIPICLVLMVGGLGCDKAKDEPAETIGEPVTKKVEAPAMQEDVTGAKEAEVATAVDVPAPGSVEEAEPSATGEVQAVAEKAEAPSVEESKDVTEDLTKKAKKEIAEKAGEPGTN